MYPFCSILDIATPGRPQVLPATPPPSGGASAAGRSASLNDLNEGPARLAPRQLLCARTRSHPRRSRQSQDGVGRRMPTLQAPSRHLSRQSHPALWRTVSRHRLARALALQQLPRAHGEPARVVAISGRHSAAQGFIPTPSWVASVLADAIRGSFSVEPSSGWTAHPSCRG